MDQIIAIIKKIKPAAVFDENTKLFEEHVLDSLAMVSLVSNLCDEFDIDISPIDVVPENFETVKSIANLVKRIEEDD